MKKENIFIDLSKCSEEERKQIAKLILIKSGLSMSDYLDLLHGEIDEPGGFYLLEYAREQWHLSFDVQKHKTELLYHEFIKLFESGEDYPGKRYQPLFDHLNSEHGLILHESEMDEIIRLVQET